VLDYLLERPLPLDGSGHDERSSEVHDGAGTRQDRWTPVPTMLPITSRFAEVRPNAWAFSLFRGESG